MEGYLKNTFSNLAVDKPYFKLNFNVKIKGGYPQNFYFEKVLVSFLLLSSICYIIR